VFYQAYQSEVPVLNGGVQDGSAEPLKSIQTF
jgi:hypothetical protein